MLLKIWIMKTDGDGVGWGVFDRINQVTSN